MNCNVKKTCNTYLTSHRDRKRKEIPCHTTVVVRHLRLYSESRFMHEKENRKVAKILSIQDQLHDYGMASAKARLVIKSRQNHIMLDSGKLSYLILMIFQGIQTDKGTGWTICASTFYGLYSVTHIKEDISR